MAGGEGRCTKVLALMTDCKNTEVKAMYSFTPASTSITSYPAYPHTMLELPKSCSGAYFMCSKQVLLLVLIKTNHLPIRCSCNPEASDLLLLTANCRS